MPVGMYPPELRACDWQRARDPRVENALAGAFSHLTTPVAVR
jgi:hypothetical protein